MEFELDEKPDEKKQFEFEEQKGSGTNRVGERVKCDTCHGNRFVLVRLRSPEQTLWMEERKITPSTRSFYEEYAPCPECHTIEIEYYRFNGTPFRVMDRALVRQAMRQ